MPDGPRSPQDDKAAGIRAYYYEAIDESLEFLRRAKAANPSDGVVRFFLALSLQAGGLGDEAAQEFNCAARIDPSYALCAGMGQYLSRRRRIVEGAVFEDGWLTFLGIVLDSNFVKISEIDDHDGLPFIDRGSPIPRRIMQYWDNPTVPSDVAELMEACRHHHKEYEYVKLTEDDAKDFILERYGSEMLSAYESCFHVSAKSDFIRFAYLYDRGGFYVDADELCTKPFTRYFTFPDVEQVFSFSRALTSCINTWFIGTIPGSRIIELSLNNCVKNIRNTITHGLQSNAWVLTGPGNLSFAFLDTFCDVSRYRNGDPLGRTILIDERNYRKIFHSPPNLEYKTTVSGNWRLFEPRG
jgi:hypothetical protein